MNWYDYILLLIAIGILFWLLIRWAGYSVQQTDRRKKRKDWRRVKIRRRP